MRAVEVVEAYLQLAFNISDVSQKSDLMELTTGDLKAALAGTSDSVFQKAYVDRRYKLMSFSVLEKRDRTPRETEVTFQLNYREVAQAKTSISDQPTVITENTVSLIWENKLWKIRDVLGSRTSFDFPVTKESVITASPKP